MDQREIRRAERFRRLMEKRGAETLSKQDEVSVESVEKVAKKKVAKKKVAKKKVAKKKVAKKKVAKKKVAKKKVAKKKVAKKKRTKLTVKWLVEQGFKKKLSDDAIVIEVVARLPDSLIDINHLPCYRSRYNKRKHLLHAK